jgi:glycosyltransferase involved in cell wall biosynthesis
MRICYFGTYRANYSRNKILIEGLRAQSHTVYECHAGLWRGIEDRVNQASGGWKNPAFLWRVIRAYLDLLRTHYHTPVYDVMLIGYPGQFDTFLGRLLSWMRRKPMALDILMSLHLVAEERGLTRSHPHTGRLIFAFEKLGLRLPDLLIAENEEYGCYLQKKYKLSKERFRFLSHGADDKIFFPRDEPPGGDTFRVSYHGTYVPSHGLDTIVTAAELLKGHPDIRLDFFGIGPEKKRLTEIVRTNRLSNVHFHGYVSLEELLEGLANSHVCLGVFGVTRQALFTVQNKVWEGLAMRRAVVSGEAPTVNRSLKNGEHIYLVERNNPRALADAILELKGNPDLRTRLARQGYERFVKGNSVEAISAKATEILEELVEW